MRGNERTTALVYEAAHDLADHLGRVGRENAKTVVENSTFVVLVHDGIDTGSHSFPSLARWAEGEAVLRRNLTNVPGLRRVDRGDRE